ncbi:MAG: MotA/TolQ/ExbB proton channel family protein [Pseudomonadota bacterium]
MFANPYEQIYLFMERGGSVLYAILFVVFVLWVLIVERLVYFFFVHRRRLSDVVGEWEARRERTSWYAHNIRQDLVAQVEIALEANMGLIKVMVAICPLLGLVGTVTGMIEVFDVMAFMGSGSPRAMASGIFKAMLPTMAGMVGAITGIFAHSLLQRRIEMEKIHIEDQLTFDH